MLVAQYLHLKVVPSVFNIVEYRSHQYRIFLRLRDCMFFLHVVSQLTYNSHRTYYVYFLEFDLTECLSLHNITHTANALQKRRMRTKYR